MSQPLQPSFRALADPTRREILRQLCEQELTITEVVDKFELTRTAVRKHLTVLEQGRLITVTARGKERITQLNPDGLRQTADWFNYFNNYWDTALGALKQAVEGNHNEQPGE